MHIIAIIDTIDTIDITIDIIDTIDISDIIDTTDVTTDILDIMGLLCAPYGTPIGFLYMMSFVVGLSVRAFVIVVQSFVFNSDSYVFFLWLFL